MFTFHGDWRTYMLAQLAHSPLVVACHVAYIPTGDYRVTAAPEHEDAPSYAYL